MKRRTDAACPPNCPNRCAIPNCHNEKTCPIWAKHMQRKRELQERIAKAKASEDDVTAVRVECSRRIAREIRRHRGRG